MSRSLSHRFLRNLYKHLLKKNTINATIYRPRSIISRGSKLVIGSQICCAAIKSEERPKIDIENGLTKACEEGDTAVILLMEKLKDFVIVVCREYRNCLMKQIEITETASTIGPFSEVWDELPQYRTLADELHKELNDYMAVFNTIGEMTNDETLVYFVTGSSNQLNSVAARYKELDVLLQREFEQNRKIESKLLKMKRDSILKDVY